MGPSRSDAKGLPTPAGSKSERLNSYFLLTAYSFRIIAGSADKAPTGAATLHLHRVCRGDRI